MSAQEQIGKLQGLLERIQKNSGRPRASAPVTAPLPPPVAFAPVPALPAEPPPLAAAAPQAALPPPAATPVPAAPPPYVPPPASLDDQSIDDLLGDDLSAPPPVEVDVPLDTLPPVAPSAEEEAIPLLAVSAHQPPPEPPAIEDGFMDSEVSEVRATTAPRETEAEVTVAAIEAEAEPMGTEELSDDDLVEVTEGTPQPSAVDIDFDDEEEPPASSQRARAASTIDGALAAAAAQLDHEHEVPLKTPPPESGPQEAPVALAAPPAPDVDALLGEELDIPTRAHTTVSAPTPEQLGQTIDLDEARGPSLELAEQPLEAAPVAPVEELEVALPEREVAGGYDDGLMPPPEARDDLEAHRRRMEEDLAPPPESLATLPSIQPGPAAEIIPLEAQPLFETAPLPAVEVQPVFETAPLPAVELAAASVQPEIVARPLPMGGPESFESVRETFRPSSFVELLDASLSL